MEYGLLSVNQEFLIKHQNLYQNPEQQFQRNITPAKPTAPITSIPSALEPTSVDTRKIRYIQMKDSTQHHVNKPQTKPYNNNQPHKSLTNSAPVVTIPPKEIRRIQTKPIQAPENLKFTAK